MASVKAVLFTLSGLRARLAARPWPRFRMIYKRQQKSRYFHMPGLKHSNAYKNLLEKELNDAHQPQKRSRHLQLTTRVQNGTPEGPKEAQRAPKRPQRVAKKMPGDLKDREGAPTGSQRLQKSHQRVPKVSKGSPKGPKWSPKEPKG